MVVACEVAIATVNYVGPDNQIAPNPAGSWAFGQVISVVMLFSQFWDIVFYPLGVSRHSPDVDGNPVRRYQWWYRKHFLGEIRMTLLIIWGLMVLVRRRPADRAQQKDEEMGTEKAPSTVQGETTKEIPIVEANTAE